MTVFLFYQIKNKLTQYSSIHSPMHLNNKQCAEINLRNFAMNKMLLCDATSQHSKAISAESQLWGSKFVLFTNSH